jgi:hypothetical protein
MNTKKTNQEARTSAGLKVRTAVKAGGLGLGNHNRRALA